MLHVWMRDAEMPSPEEVVKTATPVKKSHVEGLNNSLPTKCSKVLHTGAWRETAVAEPLVRNPSKEQCAVCDR